MSYEKALAKHGLSDADVERIVDTFMARAEASSESVQPRAIYHSAALDLVLGACEMSEEVSAGMKAQSSAHTWLAILSGVER
jgi:hypothetical protein